MYRFVNIKCDTMMLQAVSVKGNARQSIDLLQVLSWIISAETEENGTFHLDSHDICPVTVNLHGFKGNCAV
jgi:hypothetical protein